MLDAQAPLKERGLFYWNSIGQSVMRTGLGLTANSFMPEPA